MKPVGGDLADRLLKSSIHMLALSRAASDGDRLLASTWAKEASYLLALMHAMLTDEKPLTNWDLIDTQLHKLLAEGDVPTVEEAEKIMAVQRMLREVSGE